MLKKVKIFVLEEMKMYLLYSMIPRLSIYMRCISYINIILILCLKIISDNTWFAVYQFTDTSHFMINELYKTLSVS